ncbi:F-box-like protein [Cinnamomum micranthum f. kanehirae]|uniref:F-box-like protein n=1 Tax=Cinnamomum micranthum f. kanehirae TaxID=337451 RepID=A0A3S3QHM6_9MAGN|nr:F-box-like protein [Cinnamomum micranthum f. kanehirae]
MDICTVAEAKKRAPNDEPDIGDDIWIEILSRLHPKTLTRLKCTSKTWHRLASTVILHSQIKTPISGFFIRLVRLSTRKESIRYLHHPTAAGQSSCCADYTLSFLPSHPHTTILDSRHGFLLCSSSSEDLRNNYYICNPITRQWVSLPKPRNRIIGKITYSSNHFVFLSATLVFDDDPSHFSSDQYKYRVVRFVLGSGIDIRDYDEGEDEQEEEDMNKYRGPYLCIDIYSSETGKWTKSKASFERGRFFYLLNRPSVLLDGAIYMLAAPQLLLRFHVKEECFEFIALPYDNLDMIVKLPISPSEAVSCLGVRQGRLYYAYQNCRHMQVWMFDECEPSKWVLKHAVELQVFGILNPPFVEGERQRRLPQKVEENHVLFSSLYYAVLCLPRPPDLRMVYVSEALMAKMIKAYTSEFYKRQYLLGRSISSRELGCNI